MNYKKIISVFLSVLLCVMCIDTHIIYSDISNESETVYISTIINGTAKRLPAIQNEEGILFVSGEILSDITVYNNRNLKPTIFEHDNATEINKYREILIEKDNKQAHVIAFWNNQRIIKKTISLPDVINYNDELYFPIVQMLPILNTNSVINNNVLYIEDAPYSMTNIMPEFNISDYMFNMYNDNDFLGLSDSQILVAYSYLYNTFVNLESGRFIPFLSKNIVLMIIRIYLKNI